MLEAVCSPSTEEEMRMLASGEVVSTMMGMLSVEGEGAGSAG